MSEYEPKNRWPNRFRNIVGGSILLASAFFPELNTLRANAEGPDITADSVAITQDPIDPRIVKEADLTIKVFNMDGTLIDQFDHAPGPALAANRLVIIREANGTEYRNYPIGGTAQSFALSEVGPGETLIPASIKKISATEYDVLVSVKKVDNNTGEQSISLQHRIFSLANGGDYVIRTQFLPAINTGGR